MPDEQDEKYQRAKKRVRELKDFYTHLIVYAGVNVMLFVINLVTAPGAWWFYWVTIFWGIGILWHAISTFGTSKFESKSWEERKIKGEMEKEERQSQQK